MPTFELTQEEEVYGRYITVFDRTVEFTNTETGQAHTLQYDVAGHPKSDFKFAVTFPFHPGGGSSSSLAPQVTLIREYCQGPNMMAYALPTGGFDPLKHASIVDCATMELSEEAMLHGGELVRLIPDNHPGFPEVKWCANRFVPFLAIDPQVDPSPGDRDDEEIIQVLRVGIPELRVLMRSGDMMLPSLTTCYLALELLQARGLLPAFHEQDS